MFVMPPRAHSVCANASFRVYSSSNIEPNKLMAAKAIDSIVASGVLNVSIAMSSIETGSEQNRPIVLFDSEKPFKFEYRLSYKSIEYF